MTVCTAENNIEENASVCNLIIPVSAQSETSSLANRKTLRYYLYLFFTTKSYNQKLGRENRIGTQ